jgi:RimJ/RimL family protein N-acetyltransferase
MDIGYWLRADSTGRGHATRAAATLSKVGFDLVGLERIQIICNEKNARSADVARRLGYQHADTRDGSMVWQLAAPAWRSSRAFAMSTAAVFEDVA